MVNISRKKFHEWQSIHEICENFNPRKILLYVCYVSAQPFRLPMHITLFAVSH